MSQRYIGGLIYNPPGGFSGYFDGSGDSLTAANNAAFRIGSGDFTVEGWVLFPTAGGVQGIISQFNSGGTGPGWTIYKKTTDVIEFYGGSGTITVTGTIALTVGAWNHFAVVRNGSTITIYVNGVAGGTGTNSSFTDETTTALYIGARADGVPMTGYVSNARIVKGTALYTSAFTPPNGPLQAIANTSLLTCAYPTFRDGSSNNFTITVNGNTAVSTQNPFPLTQLPNPALGNQGNGVYSMSQYQALRSQNLWPSIDQYWPYVTLMLHGNGTNGAQNNTFLDSSTNNFTITRNGNTTQGTFTPYGSNWSNYFDGNGDWLSISGAGSSMSLTGNFTIECWLFRQQNPSSLIYQQLFAKASNDFAFKGAAGFGWYLYDGSSYFFTTNDNAVPYNQWSHVAWVRSGSTITMYVNGSSVGSITYASTISYDTTFTLGAGNGAEPYAGYISNFRILKGTALYTSAFTPPTTPLTAITNTSLLTCQSNRFIDNSSNNFTITRNGDVSVQRFSPFNPTTPYAAGTIGGSGYFDGSGDYLTTPNGSSFSFGTGDFTIEGWFYLDGNNQGLSDVSGGTTGYWLWLISGGVMYWQNVRNGANLISVSLSNYLSQWVHFAVVRNSGTTRIYQNGVQIASAADTTNYSGTAGDLNIGRESANPSVLKGYMSNFRIVKGTAVYTSAFTPPTTPLTNITNTSLLLNFTNGGIIDNAMMNDLETVGNAQISTSVSKFGGGSLAFDGSGDALALPANINLAMGSGDFTIEMWVNGANNGSTVGGSYPRLFTFGTAQTSGCIECYNAAGTMYIEIFGVSSITFTASTLLNSTWNHYAITRSGTSLRAFVNGTQVGTTATNSTNINLAATTQSWIGAISASAGNFNGYIDDFRITKGYARYTANFTPQRSQWQDQ